MNAMFECHGDKSEENSKFIAKAYENCQQSSNLKPPSQTSKKDRKRNGQPMMESSIFVPCFTGKLKTLSALR